MNAIDRNREIYAATGITITALPEKYRNNHPENMIINVESVHKVWSTRPDEDITFDIVFETPQPDSGNRNADNPNTTGYLSFDLASHPNNRKLVEIVKYISEHDVSLLVFGRQYDDRFYVKAFLPLDNKVISPKAYFYFLSRIGIHFETPHIKKTVGTLEDTESCYKLVYQVFRDSYPKGIQRYLDTHLNEWNESENVKRFILMDWTTPVLDLPTAREARKILDSIVYGMEGVKERLLEFLEVVRRSGSLKHNLLLIGPPGVGKTTLMQAVAKMLRLPMSVVPMSACADLEAFVGFAKTYSNSQEGLVTTALMSPAFEYPDGRRKSLHQIAQVMFLNELDKAAGEGGHHGSVQSAVLRMTDDNRSFFDVYHQLDIDLTNVMIVADANDKSKIQEPLLDRFEVVEIPPYTEDEKAVIFRNYVFPSVLKEKSIDCSEVSVTREAVSLIASSTQTAGIREMRKIASRIAGNYLLRHSWRKSTVHYTPDMVMPFLPKQDVRNTTLMKRPGSIRSAFLSGETAKNVEVQCVISRSSAWSFRLFGAENALLHQELEAAAVCACNLLSPAEYDVKVQVFGVDNASSALGQLGFPVFVAVLSAAYCCIVDGVFYGGTTLLGGMTSAACNDPDSIQALAERSGEKVFYTAVGFSERLVRNHSGEVCEFLNAETAATFLFGNKLRNAV